MLNFIQGQSLLRGWRVLISLIKHQTPINYVIVTPGLQRPGDGVV